jgi:hypothetical protein
MMQVWCTAIYSSSQQDGVVEGSSNLAAYLTLELKDATGSKAGKEDAVAKLCDKDNVVCRAVGIDEVHTRTDTTYNISSQPINFNP